MDYEKNRTILNKYSKPSFHVSGMVRKILFMNKLGVTLSLIIWIIETLFKLVVLLPSKTCFKQYFLGTNMSLI